MRNLDIIVKRYHDQYYVIHVPTSKTYRYPEWRMAIDCLDALHDGREPLSAADYCGHDDTVDKSVPS